MRHNRMLRLDRTGKTLENESVARSCNIQEDSLSLFATQHIKKMRGGSQSHLMFASDGLPYVVKFQNNPQHARVLANEFLGTRIAEAIGLSVPKHAIIEVSQNLIDSTPALSMDIAGASVSCCSGRQFASQLVGGLMPGRTVDYLPESYLAKVRNLGDFAGALVFDKWTCNFDGRQAVFEKCGNTKRYKAAFIDHGCCFGGGSWKFSDAPLRGTYARRSVYQSITGWEVFDPWFESVSRLDEQAIWYLLPSLPEEWLGSVMEIESLVQVLCGRRRRLRDLIAEFRLSTAAPFPHWRDTAHSVVARQPGRVLSFRVA